MQIEKRDEEKRSTLWRGVTLSSTVVIILVLGFFITKSVLGNPLEGEWIGEETGYYLEIDDDNELTLKGTINEVYTEIDLHYTIDKNAKTVTIKPAYDAFEEAAENADGVLAAREIDESLEEFTTSFDYSVEGKKLILTEREYGEQFVFTRK